MLDFAAPAFMGIKAEEVQGQCLSATGALAVLRFRSAMAVLLHDPTSDLRRHCRIPPTS